MYRFFTEYVPAHRKRVTAVLDKMIDGYTLYTAVGSWKGKQERAWIVEVIDELLTRPKAKKLAEKIRSVNKQECVLVQHVPNTSFMVGDLS